MMSGDARVLKANRSQLSWDLVGLEALLASDFRVGQAVALDRLLTESVTALVSEGLVVLDEIAVDGTKVRSPASSWSFTRGGRLERIKRQAAERMERLKREVAADPAAQTQAVALWHALANNLMVAHRLRTAAIIPAA